MAEPGPERQGTGNPVRKRPATLKQVADQAGVSIATASYVVSGRPRALSPETVEKVWQAVSALGYVPQASARKLKGIGTKTLGVIFPHEIASISTSPYFGQVLDGITDIATEYRYNAMLFTGMTWYQAEHGYSVYVDGRCDGHILIAPSTAPQLVGQIVNHGVPVAVVGAASEEEGVASFTSLNAEASMLAVQHLASLGHTRIAHLAGNPAASEARERESGYRAAMASLRLSTRPEWIYRGDFHRIGGTAALDYWMKLPDYLRPTAAVCANDHMAAGVVDASARHGMEIPKDFSVIGFDDLEGIQPPLTTFRQQLRQLGRLATEYLIGQIEGRADAPQVVRVEAPFIERETCGPPPAGPLIVQQKQTKGDLQK